MRVDQAGELGANWIYRGQKWGSAMRGDSKTVKQVEVSFCPPDDGGLIADQAGNVGERKASSCDHAACADAA